MELEYEKDSDHIYMLKKGAIKDDYKLQMVINNNIEGIVPMNLRYVNDSYEICYNVTSMSSLETCFSRKNMRGEDLYCLVKELKQLSVNLKKYLLNLEEVLFDAKYIFLDRSHEKYYFCYCPGETTDAQEQLRKLFDYILMCINHKDKKAVLIAYGIQQITISSDFTLIDLYDCAREKIYLLEKESEKQQIPVEPVNKIIEEVPKEKDNKIKVIDKISQIFKIKEKYKKREEFVYAPTVLPVDMVQEESNFNVGEDENEGTVVLNVNSRHPSFTLRSINLEEQISITPNIFPCILGYSRKSSDYIINNPVVSRVHIRLSEGATGYMVEDLNSSNGTYINDVKLEAHRAKSINIGDKLTLANIDFIVE